MHEDHRGIGDRQCDGHVLLDEQHTHAQIVGNPPDHGGELVDDDRCQPQAHLVDEKKFRATTEGSGDGEHLLFATGQEPCASVREWSQGRDLATHVAASAGPGDTAAAEVLLDAGQVPKLRARAVVDRDVDVARAYRDMAVAEEWAVERAHALLVLGELGDDAGRHLNEAYKAFDAFGAAPWRRRAAAGLRAQGLTVPRRIAHPASDLTDTEVQLVRLVRQGLSNRQIAAAMHYSGKTIEVYLSRVYAKTGCASRLELIRAVDTGAVRLGDV